MIGHSEDLVRDYSTAFWIERRLGNNAFSYENRGPSPRLWVPPLVSGGLLDVTCGTNVVFEDVDEYGRLQSCTGLAHLVKTTWDDTPMVVVDNHNHVFYFWYEALSAGVIQPGATLIHMDQHRDTRVPAEPFAAAPTLDEAFRYTNFHLNVGNYVLPARDAGMIGDMLFVTGGDALDDGRYAGRGNTILNIDLDFFAPEMSYIGFDRVRRFLDLHRPAASLITVATSPFFIDQERAIGVLNTLVNG